MSWESSAKYYRFVNEAVRDRLGGLHSADCLLRSGAELLVLCTNTMHRVADQIAAAVEIPFIHIADTTAGAVRRPDPCQFLRMPACSSASALSLVRSLRLVVAISSPTRESSTRPIGPPATR